MEIDDLRNRTLPSANRTLAPPGCMLLTFSKVPSSQPYAPEKAQQAKEYWVELGGTIVLIRLKPPSSAAHRAPLSSSLRVPWTPSPLGRVKAANWQVCISASTALTFWLASERLAEPAVEDGLTLVPFRKSCCCA